MRRVLLIVFVFTALSAWRPVVTAVEYPNNDMMIQLKYYPFACILRRSPVMFKVDWFLQTTLQILATSPQTAVKQEQLDLLEYCGWDTNILNDSSYCRQGSANATNMMYTLVRYSLALANPTTAMQLNYTPLDPLAWPLLLLTDVALYVPEDGNELPSFTKVVMGSNIVAFVVIILIIAVVVAIIVGACICRRRRDALQEKNRSDVVRRAFRAVFTRRRREDLASPRELDRETVAAPCREQFGWRGSDAPLGFFTEGSYWPPANDTVARGQQPQREQREQQEQREGRELDLLELAKPEGPKEQREEREQKSREWYEKDLASKPASLPR